MEKNVRVTGVRARNKELRKIPAFEMPYNYAQ
jgi:hypothetical protein